MDIAISKQDFERAIPAAREPKGKIFDVLQDAISTELVHLEELYLGAAGVQAVEAGTDTTLVRTVKHVACVRAFLNEMRGLDIVLTATGFGVVSSQDTAPASKMRVDALDGELRRKERLLLGTLLERLFRVEGWNRQPQRQWQVQTLFYNIQQLETFAGINRPKPEDWDQNLPLVMAADAFLRKHIGNAFMDELIEKMTGHQLGVNDTPVVLLCQQYIGAFVAQNIRLKEEIYMRLINRLEANLADYPTYADGEGYRLNHFKPYENHAEDSTFHFVG